MSGVWGRRSLYEELYLLNQQQQEQAIKRKKFE